MRNDCDAGGDRAAQLLQPAAEYKRLDAPRGIHQTHLSAPGDQQI